jgi:hypothetical protein
VNDSRLQQWAALCDDVRSGVADMQDEKVVPSLVRVRTYMNWAIQALGEADKELTDGAL